MMSNATYREEAEQVNKQTREAQFFLVTVHRSRGECEKFFVTFYLFNGITSQINE